MFFEGIFLAIMQDKAEQEIVGRARRSLPPAEFEKWQAERTAERRHKELCNAIRHAGDTARFRLF